MNIPYIYLLSLCGMIIYTLYFLVKYAENNTKYSYHNLIAAKPDIQKEDNNIYIFTNDFYYPGNNSTGYACEIKRKVIIKKNSVVNAESMFYKEGHSYGFMVSHNHHCIEKYYYEKKQRDNLTNVVIGCIFIYIAFFGRCLYIHFGQHEQQGQPINTLPVTVLEQPFDIVIRNDDNNIIVNSDSNNKALDSDDETVDSDDESDFSLDSPV